jgi:hypothetical protein
MLVSDNILSFFGSVGVPHHLRLILSPEVSRPTDEWLIDPSSKDLTINGVPNDGPEGLFTSLWEASDARIEADYQGAFDDGNRPLDSIVAADFKMTKSEVLLKGNTSDSGDKQKTFNLESFSGIVGSTTHFRLTPRLGDRVVINPITCILTIDDRPVTSFKELMRFFLSRLHITAAPFVSGDSIVKVAFETNE